MAFFTGFQLVRFAEDAHQRGARHLEDNGATYETDLGRHGYIKEYLDHLRGKSTFRQKSIIITHIERQVSPPCLESLVRFFTWTIVRCLYVTTTCWLIFFKLNGGDNSVESATCGRDDTSTPRNIMGLSGCYSSEHQRRQPDRGPEGQIKRLLSGHVTARKESQKQL
jgi:hypothetical protein